MKFVFLSWRVETKLDQIVSCKGSFNNYVDRILQFFAPPPPLLRGQFLYPKRGRKQTFLTPPPLSFILST